MKVRANTTSGSTTRFARRAVGTLLGLAMLATAPALLLTATATAASAALASHYTYQVGQTGSVDFAAPQCDNWGYSMLASNYTCTFGEADVYQVNSSNPVYKDVTLWENGKVTFSTRVVTHCTPGHNLCGMTNVHTVWMIPGTSTFASGAYQFDTQPGVQYCIRTTVWFFESGRWLSQSLTTHVQ